MQSYIKMRFAVLLFYPLFCYAMKLTKLPISHNNYQKTNGFDHRPIANENTPENLYKIHQLYEKKRLLDKLKNPNIAMHMKLRLIQNNQIKPPNMFAGGLMSSQKDIMEQD